MLGSPRCTLILPHSIYLLALLTLSIQASAAYPENSLASFEAAIRDGAEGIESGISCRSYTVHIP